jgi:beta-galactosidase
VTVDGPGVLQGLGSANPVTEESFTDSTCTTFDGRALAVIRPTGEGSITVTITADGCDTQHARIEARSL